MRKRLFLLAAVLAILASCQKQVGKNRPVLGKQEGVQLKGKRKANQLVTSYKGPDNDLNVFDHVGKEHNKVLGELIEHISLTGDDSMEGIRNFLVEHYKKQRGISISENLRQVEALMKKLMVALIFS